MNQLNLISMWQNAVCTRAKKHCHKVQMNFLQLTVSAWMQNQKLKRKEYLATGRW